MGTVTTITIQDSSGASKSIQVIDQSGVGTGPFVPVHASMSVGIGSLTAVPAGSTNGTPLSVAPPSAKRGARLYVTPGASITFTIASAQPSSAPVTISIANPSTSTIPANWDEDLADAQMIYVTAVTGSVLFRWY